MELVRYADRPDLREIRAATLEHVSRVHEPQRDGVDVLGPALRRVPRFQLALVDDGALVAEVHALPVHVDGDELPQGWDEAFERGMERGRRECALAARDQRRARPARRRRCRDG